MSSQQFERMPPMGQAWLRALRGKPGLAPGGGAAADRGARRRRQRRAALGQSLWPSHWHRH